MAKKCIGKVVLSKQQKQILERIATKLGMSETMRVAFLEYAKSLSLITEKLHS